MHKFRLILPALLAAAALPLIAQEAAPAPEPVPALSAETAPDKPAVGAEAPVEIEAPAEALETGEMLDPAPSPADPLPGGLDLMPSLPPLEPVEPLPLIPEMPEATERPRGEALPESATERRSGPTAGDELRERVRFREVRNRAVKDAAVIAAWQEAHRARTDFKKREELKRYYQLLYSRMRKIDASLKGRIAEQQDRSLARLEQRRIEPTEPLNPGVRASRRDEP